MPWQYHSFYRGTATDASFVAYPKIGRTPKVGRQQGVCPGGRTLSLPCRALPPSWSLQVPLSLLASLTHTTLVTLSVRQPILCHFQGPVKRQAVQ